MRILVTGAQGQLGAAIVHDLTPGSAGAPRETVHDVVALGRGDLDITSHASVTECVARVRPSAIVNCAAYNDVDGAEDNPLAALDLNAFALRSLAQAAAWAEAALVHYSTDFVFDGTSATPYTEDVPPNPRSVYAASKLLGEWFARDAPRHYVLRVESLFGSAPGGRPARGSVASILRRLQEGREVRVFTDRTISPAFVDDVARATRALLERQAPSGTYHCVNSGSCTWLELAQELARLLQVNATLVPVRMADSRLRAARPPYCVLSNAKLRAEGVEMPTWQNALARYVTGL